MKPYPKPGYRVWFFCVAVALTAFTIGIAIVVPAKYESGVADIPAIAEVRSDAARSAVSAGAQAIIGAGPADLSASKPGAIQPAGILPGREG